MFYIPSISLNLFNEVMHKNKANYHETINFQIEVFELRYSISS